MSVAWSLLKLAIAKEVPGGFFLLSTTSTMRNLGYAESGDRLYRPVLRALSTGAGGEFLPSEVNGCQVVRVDFAPHRRHLDSGCVCFSDREP